MPRGLKGSYAVNTACGEDQVLKPGTVDSQ